jgi:TRAP-type C4-dicarboxylate transport system substrate-binding protein
MANLAVRGTRVLVSWALACAVLVGAGTGPARADTVRIKMGTLAPSGSTWHLLLKEMGQKWSEATGGEVKLIIYAGGVSGNEGDMVKKMRIGQLQAAALSTIGLHDITPEPQALDIPGLVDSWEMLDRVRQAVGPQINSALEAKGYTVIGWSEVGFIRFFSTKKFSSLADMQKNAKIWCFEGDPASVDAWRAAGFHPVVTSSTDIVPSLQTGLIDTVPMAPLYGFTSRIFERAKYMADVPWAVFSGAMIVRKDTWDRIPADKRPRLLEIAREYAKKISLEVRRLDASALANMKQQGLEVVKLDRGPFDDAARKAHTVIRGRVVPAALFDQIKQITGK